MGGRKRKANASPLIRKLLCPQARACDGLVVLPNGRLDERDLGEDGLHQGGVGGVICIVRLFTFKR